MAEWLKCCTKKTDETYRIYVPTFLDLRLRNWFREFLESNQRWIRITFLYPTTRRLLELYFIRTLAYNEHLLTMNTCLQWTLAYNEHSHTTNTRIQWTLAYNEHSLTMNRRLQWTLAYNEHSPTMNTCLQRTLAYNEHLLTKNTRLQWTLVYNEH